MSKYDITADILCCPITHQIMFDPVSAEDGHTYEREAIEKWMREKSISPTTNKYISHKLIPNYFVRNLIENMLEQNKKLIRLQYIPSIFSLIDGKRYIKLFDRNNFTVEHLRLLVLKKTAF